jgi:hypothetical protein
MTQKWLPRRDLRNKTFSRGLGFRAKFQNCTKSYHRHFSDRSQPASNAGALTGKCRIQEQIIGMWKEQEAGAKTADICR